MRRILAILLVPVALAVMLPLVLVFVVLFYISVQVRALLHIAGIVWHNKPNPSEPLQAPHFLDGPVAGTVAERTSSVTDERPGRLP